VPLGIVIPVYNEAENIGQTLQAIEEKVNTPHRIYIVYDFAEDNTLPVAKGFLERGIDLTFVLNTEGGVLNAIREGLSSAGEDYLLVTMADMSDDYKVVDKMCEIMSEGYDIVCGSRYMKGGRQIGGPFLKKTLSRIAGVSLKYLTGIPVRDATNSFKLYRRSMLETIEIESDGGFEIGMEILVKAYFSGYKIEEVPCSWIDREKGQSRFRTLHWIPKYLKWYFFAIRHTISK
jgi:glycosyltransferase involved in cell wall biosynthesis